MFRVLLLIAAGALAASSQTKKQAPVRRNPPAVKAESTPPTSWPLDAVEVEGNRLYPTERIAALAGLKSGQIADPTIFEKARDRLVASGAFESVAYRFAPSASGKGYAVTFEVAEIAQVYRVRFERLAVPDPELRRALLAADPLFGDRIPGTKIMLARYTRLLEGILAKNNQTVTVDGRVTGDKPDELYILFYPAGAPPVVAEVKFVNTKVLPAATLQRAVAGPAVGTEFREGAFAEILDASIRPLYEERGRIRVAFPTIEAVSAKEVKGVVVTVHVEEGPSFDLGDVRVEGTQTLDRQLLELADLKSGDIVNFQHVEQARQKIHDRMHRLGYMRVDSTVERSVDDAHRKVDLVLRVAPGPQFLFGKLRIQGLDINGEAAVKKMWAMDPGKPFNSDYPRYFLDRIREDGIFDNLGRTRPDLTIDDAARTVDVTLVFFR